MKTTLIFLFVILLGLPTAAQRQLKYSRVHEVVLQGDKEKSYSLLLAFQKQEPEFANAYFQLALIAEFWARDYDPLTDPRLVRFFAYNTKLYYGLCQLKLQAESKGNRDYYENGGITPSDKKLSLEDIAAFVTVKAEEMRIYEKNINEITSYFEKTVGYYNVCVSEFKDINSQYTNIKNMYLSEDPELVKKLTVIQSAFDSSKVYFDKYRKVLDRFPIKSYDQHYILKPIVTYRLDGLTQSNFLKNKIELWDYNSWVKDVKQTMQKNISTNKTEIDVINSDMNERLKNLEREVYSDNFRPYVLDEKFVYKIEKYDPQSLLTALFKYKESQVETQTLFRKLLNNPQSITRNDLRKHTEYVQLITEKESEADSLLHVAEARINSQNVQKYQNFYLKEYNGLTGLRDYILRQNLFLKGQKTFVYEHYQTNLFAKAFPTLPRYVTFVHKTNTLRPYDASSSATGLYATSYAKIPTGYWLAGFEKRADQDVDFVAFADTTGTVRFLKTGTSGTHATLISAYEQAAVYCVQEVGVSTKLKLFRAETDGKVTEIYTLNTQLLPVFLDYDGLNNEIVLVLSNEVYGKSASLLEIYRIKPDGTTPAVPIKIVAKGSLFDCMKINNDLYVFMNFQNYVDNEEHLKTASASRNILLAHLTTDGKVQFTEYQNNKSMIGLKAVKISSNNITISGVFSEPTEDVKLMESKPLFFMQIDNDKHLQNANW